MPACAVLATLAAVAAAAAATASKPHVVFIVSDDLGYNDVSFHGSSQIPTPHIDALAKSGVILSNYYVQPVCSPTRATFATGRHVVHTGVYDPMNGGSGDLSRNFSLWSDGFKSLGYQTHAIGKWHLGMSSWQFTPLERGFDTYYGYLGGGEDYWTHVSGETSGGSGIDLWDGRTPVTNASCLLSKNADANCSEKYYSATLFTNRATKIIAGAALPGEAPLFLYLAYQSVHSPDEAPQHLIDRFNATIPNEHRRTFAGMVTALDIGVGRVADALNSTGMLPNTVLIFSTDNGGPADGFNGNMACNWPLRGMKRTLFEGGVRGVGFVYGAGLHKTGIVANGMVHASDWFHTLLRVGVYGVNGQLPANTTSADAVAKLLPMHEPPFADGDGMDVWDYLRGATESSPRVEVLHEAHASGSELGNGDALRVGHLKVVVRSGASWSTGSGIGSNDGWFGGVGSSDTKTGPYCVPNDTLLNRFAFDCPTPPADFKSGFSCENDKTSPCLFNVTADPCEQVDLSTKLPAELAALMSRLNTFRRRAVTPEAAHPNPNSNRCPYRTTVNGVHVVMPCENNATHGPSPPVTSFALEHGGQCLTEQLTMTNCDPMTTRVWGTQRNGATTNAIESQNQCLKVLEVINSASNCSEWHNLHVGVCRGDTNSIIVGGEHGDQLTSLACPGLCVAVGATDMAKRSLSRVQLMSCASPASSGWRKLTDNIKLSHNNTW